MRFLLLAFVVAANQVASQVEAQTPDSAHRVIRITGHVASLNSTRPVIQADVRFFFVDSANAKGKGDLGDVFVDSARSHVAVTDSSGAFLVRNALPGRYLMQVRRLGFSPMEALMNVDTLSVDVDLAMTQVDAVLPEIRISATGSSQIVKRLDRVGFTGRRRAGHGAKFVDRGSIIDYRAVRPTDMLERYGIGPSARILIDGLDADWDVLRNYPVDAIVGMEFYSRYATLPEEFSGTRGGLTALNEGRPMSAKSNESGGMSGYIVLVWTYLP